MNSKTDDLDKIKTALESDKTLFQTQTKDQIDDGTIEALGPMSAISVSAFYLISYGGYFGLTWGWFIPSVILLPQVLAVSELCSSMPVNGAYYWWAAALAPPAWSRCVGFISGWVTMFGLLTGIASFSYAVAAGLAQSIMIAKPDWSASNPIIMAMALAVVVSWALTMALRLESISIAYIFTAAVMLLYTIIYLIALPVTHAVQGQPFPSAKTVFGSYQNYTDWDTGVAVTFTWFCAAWVNSIWMAPAYVAEETHNSRISAPKAMITSYLSTCMMGLFVTVITAFCIPDMDTLAADPSGYYFYTVLLNHWGRQKASAFLLFIAPFSTFGGSGMLLTYATQIAAFARDGGLPFASYLTHINKRLNLPLNAVCALSTGTALLLLLSLSESAKQIIYSLAVLCGLLNSAVPVGLRLFAGDRWIPGPWNCGRWSKPIHGFAFLSQIYFMIMESFPLYKAWDAATTFNYNWVVTLGVLLISIVLYLTYGRKFAGIPLQERGAGENTAR
ncbi:uncharacterized protein N7496_007566 [Penicillium cataractarum]|uniref:Uncharacterized protein n=1 Tax=Penicillium cataractarum TaxID=2100454 RepID=A0A9W9S5Q9_9EURO|nr:uncharacterized protein N7496_007566 [Penicillium cataractarum]KAJ5371474.1 hypothetical protein N7496_007566 [Penicillium cataractarum]